MLDYVFCCASNAVSAGVCVEVAATEGEAIDRVGRVSTGGSGVIEFNIVGCGVGGKVSEEVIEIGLVGIQYFNGSGVIEFNILRHFLLVASLTRGAACKASHRTVHCHQ